MKAYCKYFSECGPRKKNEDYITIKEMPEHGRSVFVLCDGMGGHENGELASRIVAESISTYLCSHIDEEDVPEKIKDACEYTMNVFNEASKVEMGTTMAMVSVEGSRALLAHCGDSRIYIVRKSRIIYQSTDHVAITVNLTPIITRAFFTGSSKFMPDIDHIELENGDIILICSDGVFGNGKWSDLNSALVSNGADEVYDKVLEVASKSPHDNYSAIVIHFTA